MDVLKFSTVSDLMHRLALAPPMHPLIALVNYDQQRISLSDAGKWFMLDFYKITFKRTFQGSVKYGPGSYDFKEGGMAFLGPGQVVQMSSDQNDYEGYALYFHPDLLVQYPLGQSIKHYGFFDYTVAEALFLSAKEKNVVDTVLDAIGLELENSIDQFSNDVLVAQLDLLFNHSKRFYNRQFQTRTTTHHELIVKMNTWMNEQLASGETLTKGLPSPQDIAAYLKVSQRYLSDMLRSMTGLTTQQHIHLALIEKAKLLLNQTDLNVAEIAYQLGFEHPQSFSKLFKQRTNVTPVQFRRDRQAGN